jgi:AraC-like DNA-binding protein
MTRLVRLQAAARRLADTALPEVRSALEYELVHALVTCMDDERPTKIGSGWRHHTAVINRFEEALAANSGQPLYLTEICAAVGVSERVLRLSCEEHLGMGPIRYLWLRRMHLARRALLSADPEKATVTQMATDYGFWELGRFSVSYHALFGESPSATLHKPTGHPAIQARPSDFACPPRAPSDTAPLCTLQSTELTGCQADRHTAASGRHDGKRDGRLYQFG